ncbi:luciferase-like monooxygenase family protein (plasmid) [Sinorhizobium sp. RAC02]|nr:luciferase-like monooxygenase family protein [Sinorhizobium sp. RAC02]
MSGNIHLHWYLPTNGDSRGLTGSGNDSHVVEVSGGFRAPTLSYLGEVARAAEQQHFHAVLTPTAHGVKTPGSPLRPSPGKQAD